MRITEINTVLNSIEYAGEVFINLQELNNLLKKGVRIEMDECLIIPYYIQNGKRLELYQYEFCCTDKIDFPNYILKLTGKEKMEDVSEEILYLRRNCFSTYDEPDRLVDFLTFIFENETLKNEVKLAFGEFCIENLYATVY